MLAISGIWLIGCQFTWLAFGMLELLCFRP